MYVHVKSTYGIPDMTDLRSGNFRVVEVLLFRVYGINSTFPGLVIWNDYKRRETNSLLHSWRMKGYRGALQTRTVAV